MTNKTKHDENAIYGQLWRLVTVVRDSCFSAAVTAYEDASNDGLCHDGAWECALEAMCCLDFESINIQAIAER